MPGLRGTPVMLLINVEIIHNFSIFHMQKGSCYSSWKTSSFPSKHRLARNPIHAHFVYVDKNGTVRGSESSQSIQIDRTFSNFQELVK
ncbi:MAG TPA: hypothetical protein VKM55_10180 [Candidatus Lokiarchaeia archaeon]|nr:hypothetical protein [Candidatus Lokiarchaeia archaeon]